MRGPWQIPQTWAWVEAGEIAEIVGGGTPRTDDPSNFDSGDVPWITPADLSGYKDKYISTGARNITRKGLNNSGARLMPEGTVLFSSRAPIGYVAIASNPVSTNQGFKSFVLHPFIKPDYAYYYLQRAKDLAIELSSGTTFREISGAKAALIPFPVAPIAEQERIVAEIEKQFTRLDVAITAIMRVRTNAKRYRSAVLKAACEGRLVPTEAELARREGRSYEPAFVLIQRVITERDSLSIRGSRHESSTEKLPEGWSICRSEYLFNFVTSGSRGWAKYYSEHGAIFIRIGNLDPNSISLDLREPQYVSPPKGAEGVRTRVVPGDILISITAELGSIALVPDGIGEAYINQHIALARPTKHILAKYLAYYLATESGGRRQLENLRRGATKAGLGLDDIRSLEIPIPPLAEQQRIADEIDRRVSVLSELETQTEASLKRATRLRQSMLTRAFEGRLVPQDPNEEPAGRFIDRIRMLGRPGQFPASASKRGLRVDQEEKMTSSRQSSKTNLSEVLRAASKPLSPEELFSKAGYERETIDDFYAVLKEEVRAGRIREIRPDRKTVKLQATHQ
jgi:type I restriction enzyme, S subunit